MSTTEETKPAKQAPLILTGTGYELTVSDGAVKLKADLIAKAEALTVVETAEDVEEANQQIAYLARVRISVDKTREQIKAPVLEIGRTIDSTAKTYILELKGHEDRLAGLVGAYAAEQRRKAQALEAERQRLEKQRRDQEAEAERQRLEAERLKKQAEEQKERAKQQAFEAETAKERKAAAAEQAKAEAEAKAAKDAADAAEASRVAAAASQQNALQQALSLSRHESVDNVKFDLDFEVTDLAALYAFAAECVELKAKRAEILKLVAIVGKDGSIPGITIKEVPRVSKRRAPVETQDSFKCGGCGSNTPIACTCLDGTDK